MAKQMLLYESVVPITLERHKDWSVEKGKNFSYSASTNACPLMVSEFRAAAATLPVVFNNAPDGAIPVVIMGLEPEKSRLVDAEGNWTGRYIPAFIRRYPFVFATDEDREKLTLCIDEEFVGIDRDGKTGDRLFDDEGNPTEAMNTALEFTKNFEIENRRTKAFGRLMAEHNLLDPMNARVTESNGETRSITGFSTVSRERLKALDADVVKSIFDSDALELIYLHLMSMTNIETLAEIET